MLAALLGRTVLGLRSPLRNCTLPRSGEHRQEDSSHSHTQAYRLWTYEKYHRSLIWPGACMCLTYLLLLLRDMQGFYQRFVTCSLAGMAVCVIVLISSQPAKAMEHAWVRRLVIAFSLGKIVLTSLMAFSPVPPAKSVVYVCSRWLDTFTNLGVTVPALAMADWTMGTWLLYVGLHLVATTPFFTKWLHYSIIFAVFNVTFTQGLCFATYALTERSKYLAFFKQQKKLKSSDGMQDSLTESKSGTGTGSLARAVRWVKDALTIPLRNRFMSETVSFDGYLSWAWENHNKIFMQRLIFIMVGYVGLLTRDMKGMLQTANLALLIANALFLAALSYDMLPFVRRQDQYRLACRGIIAFVGFQISLTYIIAFGNLHPGKSLILVCTYWMDTFTNALVTTTVLAMTDMSTLEYALYVCCHISSSAPLFVHWLHYSVAFAVFKVIVIQGVCLAVHFLRERWRLVVFLAEQKRKLERKISHIASASRTAAVAESSSSRSPSPSAPAPEHAISSSGQKVVSTQECYQPSRPPYVSCFKTKKVMIKVHCDIEPEVLLTSGHMSLLSSLMSTSLPHCCMVESAVRHGCVVLSVDLCEPARLAKEPCLHSSASTEHEVASRIAGSTLKWLHASDAQQLTDGAIVLVQVNNSVFKGCWDASKHSVQLLEDMTALPTKDQYSIALSEPAILLPTLQPEQQQQKSGVSFAACVSLPPDAKLVGWQDKRESDHEEEEGVLQLLAHTRGIFLPVEATEVSRADNGERTVQVCVALPDSLLVPGQSLRMKLELVRGSTMLSTCSILMMDSQLSADLQELQRWAAHDATPAQVSMFVEDLAEYLSFQGLFTASDPQSTVSTSSMSCASGAEVPEEGLLPVLRAEARRSEVLHMMAEVGMELLQHAVSWGMLALAQRLLNGLMAAPLSVPFKALACGQLPHSHPFAKGEGTQLQQQQQQQKVQEQQKELGDAATHEAAQHAHPPALSSEIVAVLEAQGLENAVQKQDGVAPSPSSSRSLITCALLSYDQQCLAHVLEWGRAFGHAWPWDAVDASGYSPLEIMQRLPVGHAVLEQLLADPTAKPAALQAQALAQQRIVQHEQNLLQQKVSAATDAAASHSASHTQQTDGPAQKVPASAASAPCQLGLHTQRSSGSVNASAGQDIASIEQSNVLAAGDRPQGEEGARTVRLCTTVPQQALAPNRSQKRPYPRSELRVAMKAVVLGFGKHADIKESDYRDWCFESTAGYGNMWCRLVILIFSYTVVKCLYNGLLLNAVIVSLYPIPIFLALQANSTKKRKVYMTIGKIILWTLLLMFSMGVLPSVLFQKLSVLHLDWPVEVLMFRLVDQAQLGPLLLECAIGYVSSMQMYAKLGFSFPLLRALALSLSSLLVGVTLDVWNRCIFLKIRALSAAGVHGSQGKVLKVQ